jgi:MSHA biogenesis protein MshE
MQASVNEFHRGAGCHHCNNTGYQGRIGVYELLEVDDELGAVLARGDSAEFHAQARKVKGYVPLDRVAYAYARSHVTTLEEVLRISADVVLAAEPEVEPAALAS